MIMSRKVCKRTFFSALPNSLPAPNLSAMKQNEREPSNAATGDQAPGGGGAPRGSRRTVRRGRVRSEIIDIAVGLFRQKGYEDTTVSDIMEAAGLSPRTFFRYFKAKDDLVFALMDQQGEIVLPELATRPASESPLRAMEHAFLLLADALDANRKRAKLLIHLIFDTPSLNGRYHHEHYKWVDEWVRILLRTHPLPADQQFMLRVQVATSITAFVTAIRHWATLRHATPLRPWVEAAFASLAQGATDGPPRDPRGASGAR
jgi:AcrR family transcriptional regulator